MFCFFMSTSPLTVEGNAVVPFAAKLQKCFFVDCHVGEQTMTSFSSVFA